CVSLYCAVRVSCGRIQLDKVPLFHADPPAGDIRGRRLSRRQTLAEAGSRRLAHAAADSLPHPPDSGSEQLTDVRPGKVDELVALAREHSADEIGRAHV